ncbi:MAG: NAD(P)H-hydrate epimerase, partial [Clostridia bacterium]|nr:NAD(P)H-hydrate epimerase [Clostridia bacterium]
MIKVVSVDNMRKSDANTAAEISFPTLIERAGRAIFDTVEWHEPVAIVCGIGNNAADGFVVAELLTRAGKKAELFLLTDRFTEAGRLFFDRCQSLGVPAHHGLDALCLDGFATVLDCIFGTGFKGEIEDPFRTAIERINASGAYVVSVDINSGLGGDSGIGKCCVRSDLTVSLGNFKSGHFLNSAKDNIGKKVNCDIGIELLDEPAYLIEAEDIRRLFTGRRSDSNKGDYGYVTLIGGSMEYSGAAKLANIALSSLRAGAGVA